MIQICVRLTKRAASRAWKLCVRSFCWIVGVLCVNEFVLCVFRGTNNQDSQEDSDKAVRSSFRNSFFSLDQLLFSCWWDGGDVQSSWKYGIGWAKSGCVWSGWGGEYQLGECDDGDYNAYSDSNEDDYDYDCGDWLIIAVVELMGRERLQCRLMILIKFFFSILAEAGIGETERRHEAASGWKPQAFGAGKKPPALTVHSLHRSANPRIYHHHQHRHYHHHHHHDHLNHRHRHHHHHFEHHHRRRHRHIMLIFTDVVIMIMLILWSLLL